MDQSFSLLRQIRNIVSSWCHFEENHRNVSVMSLNLITVGAFGYVSPRLL